MVSGSVSTSEPLVDSSAAQTKRNLTEVFEFLSKAVVFIVFVSYVFGFLIVSIHNSEYGFGEINPLKPKILAAGALFVFLTFFPIVVAQRYFVALDKNLTPIQKYARWAVAAAGYLLRCNLYGVSFVTLYAYSVRKTAPEFHWNWRNGLQLFVLMVVFIATSHFVEQGQKLYKEHPKAIIVIGCFLLAAALTILVWWSNGNIATTFELWLFGIGVIAVIEHQIIGGRIIERTAYNWLGSALMLIPALVVFATGVYPQIKTSWGGGSTTPVVVYFSTESRILPGQHFEGDLLDESDSGIYVVKPNEKQAIFVPRSAISAMYFSDKPLGPEFVKDTTSPVPKKP